MWNHKTPGGWSGCPKGKQRQCPEGKQKLWTCRSRVLVERWRLNSSNVGAAKSASRHRSSRHWSHTSWTRLLEPTGSLDGSLKDYSGALMQRCTQVFKFLARRSGCGPKVICQSKVSGEAGDHWIISPSRFEVWTWYLKPLPSKQSWIEDLILERHPTLLSCLENRKWCSCIPGFKGNIVGFLYEFSCMFQIYPITSMGVVYLQHLP